MKILTARNLENNTPTFSRSEPDCGAILPDKCVEITELGANASELVVDNA